MVTLLAESTEVETYWMSNSNFPRLWMFAKPQEHLTWFYRPSVCGAHTLPLTLRPFIGRDISYDGGKIIVPCRSRWACYSDYSLPVGKWRFLKCIWAVPTKMQREHSHSAALCIVCPCAAVAALTDGIKTWTIGWPLAFGPTQQMVTIYLNMLQERDFHPAPSSGPHRAGGKRSLWSNLNQLPDFLSHFSFVALLLLHGWE